MTSSASMRVLFDTNVLLDVLLARAPWSVEAAELLDAALTGRVEGLVAGHAVSTIHFIVQRDAGRAAANNAVSDLLSILAVVPIDGADFQRALSLGLRDYEDAVQVAACLKADADVLVTRNAKDFKGAPVALRTAAEVTASIRGRL